MFGLFSQKTNGPIFFMNVDTGKNILSGKIEFVNFSKFHNEPFQIIAKNIFLFTKLQNLAKAFILNIRTEPQANNVSTHKEQITTRYKAGSM